MEQYYITGTSTGIGRALAEKLSVSHRVTGIARRHTFSHPNYRHLTLDLSEPTQLDEFRFELPENCTRAVLINNAGVIGDVRRTGDTDPAKIRETFNTNLISTALLCNAFLREARKHEYPCLIINISSGAATYPIPSWAAYCASKAGVDMFSRVISAELEELGITRIRVFSFYPGIIDTPMQEHIRGSSSSDFSSKTRFENYKTEGELLDPLFVAEKIIGIFNSLDRYPEQVTVSLRDFL